MENRVKERLADLQGVLLQLINTCEDDDETEFLHVLYDQIENKIKGE